MTTKPIELTELEAGLVSIALESRARRYERDKCHAVAEHLNEIANKFKTLVAEFDEEQRREEIKQWHMEEASVGLL